jgi:hypothetical protein
MKDLSNFAKYRKFYVAAAGFALALLQIYFPHALWYAPLVAFLTTLGVLSVPNDNNPLSGVTK